MLLLWSVDILTPLISTIVSEFVFNADNQVLIDGRSPMVTNTLEMCVCLKNELDTNNKNQGRTLGVNMEGNRDDE